MILLLASEIASANIADAQRKSVQTYQSCVLKNAAEFHRSDLSGDTPEIVAYAAAYTCSKERSDLVEKTKAFVRERHPEMGPGSVGKVTAIFMEKGDMSLDQEVKAAIDRGANASNK